MEEEVVLCAASAYERKFYLNPDFSSLPEDIQKELKIMCVLFTEEAGGIFMLVFDKDGDLKLRVDHREDDFSFDDISCGLRISELQRTKGELFKGLEMFFRIFYLGKDSDASY